MENKNNKYVCINKNGWFTGIHKRFDGPTYGNIVTVSEKHSHNNKIYYKLLEFNNKSFNAVCFVPYDQFIKEQSESILEIITKQVEIEVEEPILN